jgi:hypothetical protein
MEAARLALLDDALTGAVKALAVTGADTAAGFAGAVL